MRHGKTQEPAARRAYEALTGAVMEPQVLVRGDYSASLDGLSLDGRVPLEIKCPVRGRRSELWQDVLAGVIPLHYRFQVQHQLMVSKAALGHLFVFDGEQGLIADVEPDPDAWIAIRDAWDVFMRHVETDQPPPLVEADTLYRDEPEWPAAAQRFIACKQRCDEAEAELAKAREALLALRRYGREEGAGVQVTRFMRAGTVDYKRVPALAGVDLEPYRGAGREEVRTSVVEPGTHPSGWAQLSLPSKRGASSHDRPAPITPAKPEKQQGARHLAQPLQEVRRPLMSANEHSRNSTHAPTVFCLRMRKTSSRPNNSRKRRHTCPDGMLTMDDSGRGLAGLPDSGLQGCAPAHPSS
jgi:hypothetical protein